MTARPTTAADAPAIAAIYNEGIAERIATFETRPRTPDEVATWFDGVHPVVVVEREEVVAGFAATFTERPRECYSDVAKVSV